MGKLTDLNKELSAYLGELEQVNRKKKANGDDPKELLSSLFRRLCTRIGEIKVSQIDDKETKNYSDREMAEIFGIPAPTYNNLKNGSGDRGKPEYVKNILIAIKFIIDNTPIQQEQIELDALQKRVEAYELENKKLRSQIEKTGETIGQIKKAKARITDLSEETRKQKSRILWGGIIFLLVSFGLISGLIWSWNQAVNVLEQKNSEVGQLSEELKQIDQELKDFKLWSVFQPSDTAFKGQFDTLIEPIRKFALKLDVENFMRNAKAGDTKPLIVDSLLKNSFSLRRTDAGVVGYGQDSLVYDFNTGVVTISPDSRSLQSQLLDTGVVFFQGMNLELVSKFEDTIKTLEDGLAKVLGYPDSSKFNPVLFYSLNFRPPSELGSAMMFRYPSYLVLRDTAKTDSLYKGYDHSTRKYFQNYLNNDNSQVYELEGIGERKAYLSSVYLDFCRKNTMPIRTLIIEAIPLDKKNGNPESLYLFCIDFKLGRD